MPRIAQTVPMAQPRLGAHQSATRVARSLAAIVPDCERSARVRVPKWLRHTLDMPGATSFGSLEPVADRVLSLRNGRRSLSMEALVELAAGRDSAPAELLALTVQASERALGVMPFRHQIIAAAAMFDGYAVEMDTGEGKTLAGAIAAATFALTGRSVHVVSVNDYLARRDAEWMGPLYEALGLTVSAVSATSISEERRTAYRADVTYVSISEVGYDILRDRFCVFDEDRVSPRMDVAIVDEADAVMIDEAVVPLVLAGNNRAHGGDATEDALLVRGLVEGADYVVDQEGATVSFTDSALDSLEAKLGGVNLYAPEHIPKLIGLNLALHAQALVHRDVDYIVENDELRLVNTTRGRIADGQRWPDGLHAAIEAKEGLKVSASSAVLDSLTVQDLLTQYQTLTGMSGTVIAVAEELLEFYALRSGRVERRLPQARIDEPDVIVHSEAEVFDAVAEAVQHRHSIGQPVLIGTQSIAQSETIAELLIARGLDVRVLNAKNDEEEARTIARAGEPRAITISTQMSGRGTDIVLGGSDGRDRHEVVERGGLAVIQVGLYPSRRLEEQLRGRSGRQGDPGSSVRISSLQDELITTTATRTIRTQIQFPGNLTRRMKARILGTAQDIAEAVRADQHRATWGYNRAIAMQRDAILQARGTSSSRMRSYGPDSRTSLSTSPTEQSLGRSVKSWRFTSTICGAIIWRRCRRPATGSISAPSGARTHSMSFTASPSRSSTASLIGRTKKLGERCIAMASLILKLHSPSLGLAGLPPRGRTWSPTTHSVTPRLGRRNR